MHQPLSYRHIRLELNLYEYYHWGFVIIYTFSGGTKVNVTQKQQMFVIMSGMFITFFLILHYLPNDMTFTCLAYRWCE
jgi:hypothetical protein